MSQLSRNSFLRDSLVLFIGVLIATAVVGPIKAESTLTLLLVALVLALLNVLLKPLLVFFALPFVIFTFGLGILLINALLLLLAGAVVPTFTVPGFGIALLGALVISICSVIVNIFLSPRPQVQVRWTNSGGSVKRRRTRKDEDVIDV
ncbi:MAG: phage holin family protein [Verrucomicrobia bacterium]|jgi:putative membrane protein|nr:phage holin family protein [Verrucomicrobiota bacterium]